MKSIFGALALILLAGGAQAANCQNLAGKFFYSNNPSQSVTIEQTGCAITMIYRHSEGNEGKPLQYLGDGLWRLTYENKYEREYQASFASQDNFRVETKTVKKSKSIGYHLVENYQLRADGNILLKSSVTSGDHYEQASRLLIRE